MRKVLSIPRTDLDNIDIEIRKENVNRRKKTNKTYEYRGTDLEKIIKIHKIYEETDIR